MKEIKLILEKCNTSMEAVCVCVAGIIMMLIAPVVFWNIHWLCGVLYFCNELLIVPGLVRLFDERGWLDEDVDDERSTSRAGQVDENGDAEADKN